MPLPPLIAQLLKPASYPQGVGDVRLIETHISWVLLAGEFAYKIKKPLDLGFLDFSTLEKRKCFCEEEVRLNRRLAPDIYLDAVAITGNAAEAKIGGDGPVLEWAVRMRAFEADSTLDRVCNISAAQIDAIADAIARFHRSIPASPADSEYGKAEQIMQPALENFAQIRALSSNSLLDMLEDWTRKEGTQLENTFEERKRTGFIRECHGDLHLGNIAWVNDAPLIFDCIEFNPNLSWIDVMSEVAFLFMDLVHRSHDGLAWRLLNRYLEHSGDYAGLTVFRFYLVYRAMVRAKVAAIRAKQGDAESQTEATQYLELAARMNQADKPALLLMHGVSGSGKTWLSQQVLEQLGAVRLRSDVERKRLFGLDALEDSKRIEGSIYTAKASRQTFQNLRDLAHDLLQAGYRVIVDATFLKQAHRAPFIDLAHSLQLPVRILAMQADESILRQRVLTRSQRGGDASEADVTILDMQLLSIEPFDVTEAPMVLPFSSENEAEWPNLIQELLEITNV